MAHPQQPYKKTRRKWRGPQERPRLIAPRMTFRQRKAKVPEKDIKREPVHVKRPTPFRPVEKVVEQLRNWIKHFKGKGTYLFYLRPDKYSNNRFTLTGSADNIDLELPFNCLLQKIEVDFNDETSKTLVIRHIPAYVTNPTYSPLLFGVIDNTEGQFIITFSENENEFEKGATIRITVTGTADKLVAPRIYLKRKD